MSPSPDEILSLYEWSPGSCFRCAREGLDTTLLSVIRPPAGGRYEVRACRDCILDLEAGRERAAERAGVAYAPGGLSS